MSAAWRTLLALAAWLGLGAVLGLGLGGPAVAASAGAGDDPPPLVLGDGAQSVPAELIRAALRVHLQAADEALDLAQARARPGLFNPHVGPAANYGRQPGAVWLRVPVRLEGAAADDWWLQVDYPALDDVRVAGFCGADAAVFDARLGDHVAASERQGALRTHEVRLSLPPGRDCELLLRVHTTGGTIVPLNFVRTDALMRAESQLQAWQGLSLGIGLAAFIYTLIRGVMARDALYLWFSGAVVTSFLYMAAYHGVGGQHLWPDWPWMVRNSPPLFLLLVIWSGTPFLRHALRAAEDWPRTARLMQAVSLAGLAGAVAFAAGVIDYRQAAGLLILLGLLPFACALPVARARVREGDRGARWMFLGWVVYGWGAASSTGLQLGLLPYSSLADHAMQIGGMGQMVAWIMVLQLHARRLREQAVAARREADRLQVVANADPLTGLINRRGLQQLMDSALQHAMSRRQVAVYVLDLDGFKPVNDEHGHDAGDELLVQFAGRLRDAVRSRDVVARLGGDEFVVMAEELGLEDQAQVLGEKLLAVCEAPFLLQRASVRVGVTVGYAIAPRDARDPAELLQLADKALYAGKLSGKNAVRRFGPRSVRAGVFPVASLDAADPRAAGPGRTGDAAAAAPVRRTATH